MKKISLGVVALLFTGLVFAQSGANDFNESTVEQIGPNNSGSVMQTSVGARANYLDWLQDTTVYPVGGADSNNADITQTGGNDAEGFQVGVGADLNLNQSGGLVTYNYTEAEQFGVNTADIRQAGEGQIIIVRQENIIALDANYVQILQGQVDPTSSDNIVSLYQANSIANFMRIIQDGSENEAYSTQQSYGAGVIGATGFLQGSHITQTGDRNFAGALQIGDNQISRITQTALAGNTSMFSPNVVESDQRGEFNSSVISQNDFGGTPDADNYTDVIQTNFTGMGGNSNIISQSGQNLHLVTQGNN
jgi:hypothetical protein